MKKNKLLLAAIATVLTSALQATITFTGSPVINSSGSGLQLPVNTLYLLVVDTGNDGFDFAFDDVLSLSGTVAQGDFLLGDDLILGAYATSGNGTTTTTLSTTTTTGSGAKDTTGADLGDPFAFVVFNSQSFGDTSITAAGNYTVFTDAEWTLRADPGSYGFNTTVSASNHLQLRGVSGTEYSIIPEPSTYALIFAGLALMGAVARRRK